MLATTLVYQPETTSVYIHWPYCLSKCPYCDFNSYNISNTISPQIWKQAYLNSIEQQIPYLTNKTITSVYFGGGTPSLMPAELIEAILTKLRTLNQNIPFTEVTLECNPVTVEINKLESFKHAGITRISVGVQSFNDNNLKFLKRTHTTKESIVALEKANSIFNQVTFDLINGLPNQTLVDWQIELTTALPFIRNHVSIYELTIEPNTPFYKQNIQPTNSKLGSQIFTYTQELLTKHGIYPYEISNYARPGYQSVHNLHYWNGGLYVGIGAGAHGRVIKSHPNNSKEQPNQIYATMEFKNPKKWCLAASRQQNTFADFTPLNFEQRLMELLLLNLRLYAPIPKLLLDYIDPKSLNDLASTKLLSPHSDTNSFMVTPIGRLQLNSIIEYLSNHLVLPIK